MSDVKKIVIIGGVAGGATAAARARRISETAQIVVLERGPYVSFANCGLPYHIGGEISNRQALLLQTPESLRLRHNLDVRVRSEATAINRDAKTVTVHSLADDRTYEEPYDSLIISTGASPLRPPLPGINHPKIFTLRAVPDMDRINEAAKSARSALVIGGGFIGLEMAENLRRRGLEVDLVEMLDQVMPPLDKEMTSPVVAMLRLQGVRVHLSDAVSAFADDSGRIVASLKSGASLNADLVVLSIGVRPESQLAKSAGLEVSDRGGIVVNDSMATSDPNILAVGDAIVVRDFVTAASAMIPLAGPANRQGRIAAENALGRSSRYRGSQGTSIVRVFDLVVAMTGASEKSLARAAMKFEKVYLHPSNHATYFPGASRMSIKLLFAPEDGKILGAQIVGREGVDTRINVVATAIQAGMTVFDLEELELAYAPQFGSAKDPLNMAGFIAANVLRGDIRLAHADQLASAILLDVRTDEEHQAGAIPGSLHIPIDSLRDRLNEVPKEREIIVYCAVGLRGYTAARILSQRGYDVRNLSGGYETYRMFNPAPIDTATPTMCGGCPQTNETERPSIVEASAATERVLDVRGRQCPGPIVAVASCLRETPNGGLVRVLASDPGFVSDMPAWCRQTGNELIDVRPKNGHYIAVVRKATREVAQPVRETDAPTTKDKTIVVFSGELDKVMASFIIANGAAAMGSKVTLFFTFWGLNALRKPSGPARAKPFMDRMFGWMMPRGATRLGLSKMNMGGLGTAMMKRTMKSKQVATLEELMAAAVQSGVRLVACAMSMDVMGFHRDELIDGVEVGGVGAYLDAASTANVNLFI